MSTGQETSPQRTFENPYENDPDAVSEAIAWQEGFVAALDLLVTGGAKATVLQERSLILYTDELRLLVDHHSWRAVEIGEAAMVEPGSDLDVRVRGLAQRGVDIANGLPPTRDKTP